MAVPRSMSVASDQRSASVPRLASLSPHAADRATWNHSDDDQSANLGHEGKMGDAMNHRLPVCMNTTIILGHETILNTGTSLGFLGGTMSVPYEPTLLV